MTKLTYGGEMLQVLSGIFDKMDVKRNGEITADEMRETLPKAITRLRPGEVELDEKTIEKIVDYFDMSANGEIEKDEFTSAGLLLMVKSMFNLYDTNKKGKLTKQEFNVLMEELGYNEEDQEKQFIRADTNKDKFIDEMEFYQALMSGICVDHLPNRIKLTLAQLDSQNSKGVRVFDVVDKQRVKVSEDSSLVVITIWVHRETNKYYKAEFPIKLSNKEKEKSSTQAERNWENEGVCFDLDDLFFQNSAGLKPKAKVQVAGLVDMGASDDILIGVNVPVAHEGCDAAADDPRCWDLALPLRIQTMERWHKERLQTIAERVIAQAAEEE